MDESAEQQYDFFAEWKVRRIPEPSREPPETYGQRLKDWALSSVGVDGAAKEIFLFIENSKIATIEEIAEHMDEKPEGIVEHVDMLYSTGLIERMGRAYFIRNPLSTSIVRRLIPRITESLRIIAKAESKCRSDATIYHKMKGRAFSDIGSAIVACKEMTRAGISPVARAVGIRSYSDESIEVEGPVIGYGHSPLHLVIVTESGERIVVGNREAKGADVEAHSIIVKGEKDE